MLAANFGIEPPWQAGSGVAIALAERDARGESSGVQPAQWPLTHPDDFIFTEYVLLHGINDGPEHAHMLADYLRGLNACVNLIPYNPGLDGTYARPNSDQVKTFFHILQDAGQRCRIRGTKGDNAMAACGQLGNRTLGRKRPALETV